MKHTSAPWYPINYSGYWNLQDKDYYEEKSDLLNEDHTPYAKANAKLAAAAPDLLEALQGIIGMHNRCAAKGDPVLSPHWEGLARTAVKKATGTRTEGDLK